MDKAISRLEQYVPKHKPTIGNNFGFWEGLEYTSPKAVRTFGPACAIQFIVEELDARKIEALGKQAEAEDALSTLSFFVSVIHDPEALHIL